MEPFVGVELTNGTLKIWIDEDAKDPYFTKKCGRYVKWLGYGNLQTLLMNAIGYDTVLIYARYKRRCIVKNKCAGMTLVEVIAAFTIFSLFLGIC